MADAHNACAVATFALSEALEEDVVKNETEDELEGLAALFLENERNPAVRIREYVEEVVYKERHARSGRYQFYLVNRFNPV